MYENDPPEGEGAPLLPHPGEAVDIPSIDGEKVKCEVDQEFLDLIEEMRKAGVLKTHRQGWFFCCSRKIKVGLTSGFYHLKCLKFCIFGWRIG